MNKKNENIKYKTFKQVIHFFFKFYFIYQYTYKKIMNLKKKLKIVNN
jgi:hypothetical protein